MLEVYFWTTFYGSMVEDEENSEDRAEVVEEVDSFILQNWSGSW